MISHARILGAPDTVSYTHLEGFDHIADLFEMVGAIEKEHEERYRRLLRNVEDKLVFSLSLIHI